MGALSRPEEVLALVKLRVAAGQIKRQIPPEEHWAFAYSMLQKVSRSFALVIQQLGPELRNAVCIFYLVLRALDTVEDDTSIPTEVKVPILQEFYRHVYNRDWHYSSIKRQSKKSLGEWEQEWQNLYARRIWMFVRTQEYPREFHDLRMKVETVDDYDEYCHYVAGLVGYGLSRLFYAAGTEDLAPDSLSNSMGLFLQKTNIIRDYLEDINEIPKSRMFWPREIWSKYADKLEDFKYEENTEKAVQCLNDIVTNALIHAEECLQYMSALKNHAIFHFCAIPQIMAIGTCALCYNNVHVFRGVVKMRRGKLLL
ncbi:Squalene synthase 1 [Zea mays]|uniref:Squalene synthase n=1 Tax=Zea mays TaxID=4577 RepID=A0A1D6L8A8_MAIZE|nr:Squalene synthase 1 [Zea mays]